MDGMSRKKVKEIEKAEEKCMQSSLIHIEMHKSDHLIILNYT